MRGVAFVVMLAGTLIAAFVPLAASAEPDLEQLTVRTYDRFGVTSRDLAVARKAAGGIMKGAGIDIRWRDCSGVGRGSAKSQKVCEDPLGRSEVIVRITHATSRTAANSLGDSMVDVQSETGTFATIYQDRVASMAALAFTDAGTLLGRAIAHELGHLLLGTAAHSPGGLMRAYWNVQDLQRDFSRDWVVSPVEAIDMRRHLGAKTPQAPDSPAVGTVRARLSAAGDRN